MESGTTVYAAIAHLRAVTAAREYVRECAAAGSGGELLAAPACRHAVGDDAAALRAGRPAVVVAPGFWMVTVVWQYSKQAIRSNGLKRKLCVEGGEQALIALHAQ